VDTVVISGYSQRASKATGNVDDEYLLSVKVSRNDWGRLNLENLSAIDPVEGMESFEYRRNMTKTGIFKPIEPLLAAP